jgi:DNA (cytosine-5)-methyltransferase 1
VKGIAKKNSDQSKKTGKAKVVRVPKGYTTRPVKSSGFSCRENVEIYRVPNPAPAQPLRFVDLFAGCGGLSLGLEGAGFQPLLFSEINPQAAETYIANRVGLDVIPVGDIYNLTDVDLELLKTYWRYKGIDDIDLVCGGPPCQGYSGIGHRRTFNLAKKDIPSNHLFQEMIRVIRCIRPKVFLFENVRGLLNARWTPEGESGEIFKAVLNEFKTLDDYRIRWDLVHAKDYGVPQNRPRVLMVGIRHDFRPYWIQNMLFESSASFDAPSAVESGFLPRPSGEPPTLEDLLSDLEDPEFLNRRETTAYPHEPRTEIQRQLRTTRDGRILRKGDPLTDHEYSDHAPYIREKFAHMIANNGEIPDCFKTKKFAQRVFPISWGKDGPNLTATSLPEDYVHYRQPRGPTVREWARLQTFPDWYQFKGPRTTGGRRRAGDPSIGAWDRDVPRYTQIGNAVPVFLGEKIGRHLAKIIRREISVNDEHQTAKPA